ncbi:hypothetical protein FACS189483_03500 [Spirochaetia bacterium]|nr:hypothetical protein FACS189483_03500 [Spirochaetia bacterium]
MEEIILNTASIPEYVLSRIHSPTVRIWETNGTIALRENGEPPAQASRVGFLKGQIEAPADFDTMGQAAITALFEGSM